jgi:hypothetical protein
MVEASCTPRGNSTTYCSPEGAAGGAKILAGACALGFGAQRFRVEVTSESIPKDRPAVD